MQGQQPQERLENLRVCCRSAKRCQQNSGCDGMFRKKKLERRQKL